VTFRSAVELLHAVETFPEGLDAVCLGLLSYAFPVPAGLEPSSAGGGHRSASADPWVAAAQARLDYQDALLRRVLGLLACLREPVSISALADLLEEVPERDIRRTLFRLACFLEVQPTPCAFAPAAGAFVSAAADAVAVQLAHPEAVAAVLARCPDRRFRLDPLLAEADLAARCLGQLVRRLRPNPLNMEDPAAWLNAEIPDRDVRVAARVPEVLRYSARNFAVHLARIGGVLPAFVPAAAAAAANGGVEGEDGAGEAADDPALAPALDDAAARALQDVVGLFSSEKLLEWIELLSLMGLFNTVALPALRLAQRYLESIRPPSAWESVLGFLQKSATAVVVVAAAAAAAPSASSLLADATAPPTAAALSHPVSLPVQRLLQTAANTPGVTQPDLALTRQLVRDAQRFAIEFRRPLVLSAFHVYVSALPFTPQATALHRANAARVMRAAAAAAAVSAGAGAAAAFRRVPQVVRGVGDAWPPCLWTLRGHARPVTSVCLSADGRHAVAGAADGSVRVFDAETGGLARALDGHADTVWQASCSPDGRWVITGGRDGAVKTWDARSGRCVRAARARTWSVNALVVDPASGRIVSASAAEAAVVVKDAASGAVVHTLKGHRGAVLCVAVSADGTVIASGGDDSTARLWDARSGRGFRTLDGHRAAVVCVALSRDGRWVFSGSRDASVRAWDAQSGRCLAVLDGHSAPVTCLAVAADDPHRVASGSDDRTVRVWDVDLDARARHASADAAVAGAGAQPDAHAAAVRAVAVSGDGRFAVSAAADNSVRVWSAESGRLLRSVEARALNVASWQDAARRVAEAEMMRGATSADADAAAPASATSAAHNGNLSASTRPRAGRLVVVNVDGRSVVMTREDADAYRRGAAPPPSPASPRRIHPDAVAPPHPADAFGHPAAAAAAAPSPALLAATVVSPAPGAPPSSNGAAASASDSLLASTPSAASWYLAPDGW
ncbi:hypothetical protein HK405_010597, partial [Cladochytrium tenue]